MPVASSKNQVMIPSLAVRIASAVSARVGRLLAIIEHPGVAFGSSVVIRRNFRLLRHPGGKVTIGDHGVMDHGMTIECSGELCIGARTIFGHHCTIGVVDLVQIGEDCLIANFVDIRDHDHAFDELDVPIRDQGAISAPTKIGRNVWIGTKATITRGVTIGDNAIIGANAVVTKDIPANAIAVGVPAHVIRMRDESSASHSNNA